MKSICVLSLLITFFSHPALAAGNPGRSAMECVSASRDKEDIVFSNKCGYKIFVVWCGEMKYTKKRCGDGPQGNSFYTQSSNIEPGDNTRVSSIQDYRYAACEGGIGFGKSEIKDFPDGSFQCIGAGMGADKKNSVESLISTESEKPMTQFSPIGTWQILVDQGEKLALVLNANGTSLYAGEYPGRWSRQGDRITVLAFADDDFMRRNDSPATLELDIDGVGMKGTLLAQRVRNQMFRAKGLTLTRIK